MRTIILISLCAITAIIALFDKEDELRSFEAAEFQQRVVAKREVWLIKFYSPGCPHCVSFAPEFKKAAKILKGIVNVGVVDTSVSPKLGSTHAPDGVPTVLLFNLDGQASKPFKGRRKAEDIVKFVQDSFDAVISKRMGIDRSSSGSDDSDNLLSGAVISLTDQSFDSEMAKKPGMLWLVEFFAPWCGHCKSLEPNWKIAAKRLKGIAILAAVDATVHSGVSSRFGVNGFPTIKAFFANAHNDPKDYDGPRDPEGIVNWVMRHSENAMPAPEIAELTSQKQFEEASSQIICVVVFLPHLLDCQSKCRNNHIAMLKEMAAKYRRNEWSWLWAEEMKFPELEDAVGVGGFGYPTMVAINIKKQVYAILKGVFDVDGISTFLNQIASGRSATVPIQGSLPKLKSSEPWDGKDFMDENATPEERSKVEL